MAARTYAVKLPHGLAEKLDAHLKEAGITANSFIRQAVVTSLEAGKPSGLPSGLPVEKTPKKPLEELSKAELKDLQDEIQATQVKLSKRLKKVLALLAEDASPEDAQPAPDKALSDSELEDMIADFEDGITAAKALLESRRLRRDRVSREVLHALRERMSIKLAQLDALLAAQELPQ